MVRGIYKILAIPSVQNFQALAVLKGLRAYFPPDLKEKSNFELIHYAEIKKKSNTIKTLNYILEERLAGNLSISEKAQLYDDMMVDLASGIKPEECLKLLEVIGKL